MCSSSRRPAAAVLAPPTAEVRRRCSASPGGRAEGRLDCIRAFSEVDRTEDLRKIDIPAPVGHGDDDQIVPVGASALMNARILKNATPKICPGGRNGFAVTNADLLVFTKGDHVSVAG